MIGSETSSHPDLRISFGQHPPKILVVDDDIEILDLLSFYLHKEEGYEVDCFNDAHKAIVHLKTLSSSSSLPVGPQPPFFYQAIMVDLKMPSLDGISFIHQVKEFLTEDFPMILMTAHGSIETAIEAMRKGAFDYITKPLNLKELAIILKKSLKYFQLEYNYNCLKKKIAEKSFQEFDGMVGQGPSMRKVFELIKRVAHADANVLIQGESGTGKELVAKAIHNKGPRSKNPFIAVNCSAIPETLLESELFGHTKGAFTGAQGSRKGLFEEAQGGTIFLDEIGEIPFALQAKLLRVIQEKSVRPLGENQDRPIDVRIIAATHKNLKQEVKNKSFREDLFYRLNVIPLFLPPLRDRREDIPFLIEHFLKKHNLSKNHLDPTTKPLFKSLSPKAMEKLMRHTWEGNVRELENVIERALIFCPGPLIEEDHILTFTEENKVKGEEGEILHFFQKNPTLKEVENFYIRYILEKMSFHKEKTAQILGIGRKTLYRKEKEFGLIEDETFLI